MRKPLPPMGKESAMQRWRRLLMTAAVMFGCILLAVLILSLL